MFLLIAFLTFILVMNCLFLMLLILIQLPKKEAGAGIAFGGAATDALFGAGSGNALTKVTKYSASLFVVLAVVLSILNTHAAKQGSRRLEQELSRQANTATPIPQTLPASNTVSRTAPPTSNVTIQVPPVSAATNLLQTTQPAAVPANAATPAATNAATPAR